MAYLREYPYIVGYKGKIKKFKDLQERLFFIKDCVNSGQHNIDDFIIIEQFVKGFVSHFFAHQEIEILINDPLFSEMLSNELKRKR